MTPLSIRRVLASTVLSVLSLLTVPHLALSFANHFIANNTYPLANNTSPVPPYYHQHYHHYTYNNTQNITYPAPNQTHPHPVPQYWMPDSSFITVDKSDDDNKQPPLVTIVGKQLMVEGKPFYIQGVCYSPIPVGESPSFDPRGDYFTQEYAWIWQRDLPLMKAMGATTIRIYGWKAPADHTAFLDAVHAAGLKVLVTYYLGDAEESPVRTVADRNRIIQQFVAQVYRYRDHPAILMWSFGNELNGSWNKFVTQISDAFGCWWTAFCAGYQDTNSDCHWQSQCMYFQLFSFINAAAKAAKVVTTRPIISGFADVDYMVGPTPWLDKVARFDWVLPDLDAWAMQLYRGYTFGGYFWMYRGESQKAMIVTEFGVDAYNDPCGWPENNGGGCFNMPGEGVGGDVAPPDRGFWGCASGGECSRPGVDVQKDWDMRLAKELMDNYPDKGGVVWGGFLMAWTDEFWKGGGTQDLCAYPCKWWDANYCRGPGAALYKPGGGALCSYKAHFTCPNWDSHYHDLCGYWLAAAPDNYVNEEWFGITTPSPCWLWGKYGGQRLDTLYVRPAFLGMQLLWSGLQEVDTSATTCDALWPCWQCTQDHTGDELEDGACTDVCTLRQLAVGPGSAGAHQRWLDGQKRVLGKGFWSRYGWSLLIGGIVLLGAIAGAVYLLLRRASQSREDAEMTTPLLVRQQRELERQRAQAAASGAASAGGPA